MKTNDPSPTLADRYVTLRLLRWLCSPRKVRVYLWVVVCAITLVAIVYAGFNVFGRLAWSRMQRELQAAGERIDLAALIPPRVPDEQNFAMTPFLAPLFDFEPGTQVWRDTNAVNRVTEFAKSLGSAQVRGDGWCFGEATDLAAWASALNPSARTNDSAASAAGVIEALEPYAPVLTELQQASRRPHARFNVRYDNPDPTGIVLPHLAVLRRLSHILTLRASARLASGNSDAALEDVLLGLDLADTVKSEPSLIAYLVRCAVRVHLTQAVWDGLAQHRWTEPQLARLQAELHRRSIWSGVMVATEGERAFGHQIIGMVRQDPTWLIRLGSMHAPDEAPAPPSWTSRLLCWSIPRGWFYLEEVEYDRIFRGAMLPAAAVASGQVDPEAVEQAAERLGREVRPSMKVLRHQRLLASMLLPAIPAVYKRAARAQAVGDQTMIACALERYRLAHGQFPETLAPLVPKLLEALPADVIQGEPLRYRRTDGGGYVLYSIGWNGTDDKGVPGLTSKGRLEVTQGDWVWPMP